MNMKIEDNINTIVVAAARMVIRLKLEVAEIKSLNLEGQRILHSWR